MQARERATAAAPDVPGPAPGTSRGDREEPRATARRPARPELWVPILYAAFAGTWIATSDIVVAALVRSVGEHTAWSMLKGFGFVAVTALLLHAGLRKALARERRAHREVQEALREQLALKEQVRQAQKLESVGRLAGGVAHDFNNLLTVILGTAEALKNEIASGSAVSVEDVDEIRAAGERARDLTRQLLAFGRRQVIAPVPTDLNAVVRGSEKLLRRILGEDVELRVDLEPDVWPILADAGQLEQVVLNLAVNARDAMPRGGTLAIETRNVRRDAEAPGSAGAELPGEVVSLVVSDSGEGMSDEVKSHLFEPFFTTKRVGQGTGLGLATVYGVVKQSGGHVHVASELGRGTAFTLSFPRTLESPRAVLAAAAAPAAVRIGTERILVVEDDRQVREVTVRSLRAAGYHVLVAGDGREALALDPQELERLDLVITDVVMPGLDGRAVIDELRRRRADLRVLYVSGYTTDAVMARGVLDSGMEFLPKPFTPSGLLGRVRAIFDAR